MVRAARTAVIGVTAAAALAALPAAAGILDFEGLPAGGPVAPVTVDGVTFSFSAAGGIDEAWLYDSSPAGVTRDPDLESPFYDAAARPGTEARKDQGNILIIQEHTGDPDDEARGGVLTIELDTAVTLYTMDVMDVSLDRGAFTAELYGSGGLLATVANAFDGDTDGPPNYYETLVFGDAATGIAGVTRIDVVLDRISGGVDNLVFRTSVPEPGIAFLLVAGLTGIAARRRRR